MSVIPNWLILVIVIGVFTAAFGGTYMLGRSAGVKSEQLKYSKQTIVSLEDAAKRERQLRIDLETERARIRDVSGKLQEALEGKKVVYVDVIRTITKEIEKPVYSQCIVPASGVQLTAENAQRLNSTRSAKN